MGNVLKTKIGVLLCALLVSFLVVFTGVTGAHGKTASASSTPTSSSTGSAKSSKTPRPVRTVPEVPEEGYIRDDSGLLTPEELENINRVLQWGNTDGVGVIVGVYVFASDSVDNEELASQILKYWRVGSQRHNGVMIVVNLKVDEVHILRGANASLTNANADAVTRENFLPNFKNKQYAAGMREGLSRLFQDAEKTQKVMAEARRDSYMAETKNLAYILAGVGTYFAVVGIYLYNRRQKKYRFADAQIYDAMSAHEGLKVTPQMRKDYRRYRAHHYRQPIGGIMPYNLWIRSREEERHEGYTQYADNFTDWLELYRDAPELYRGRGKTPVEKL